MNGILKRIKRNKRLQSTLTLLYQGFGQYKKPMAALIGLGFLSGLLEGIGINAVVPLFAILTNSDSQGSDYISQAIERFFEVAHLPYGVINLLILIIILFIVKTILQLIFHFITLKITSDFEEKNRTELFKRTVSTHWPFLMEQKIGFLEKVLMTDITYGTNLLRYLTSIILMSTGLAMYILVALNISVSITLFTLSLGFLLFLLFKPVLYKTRLISQETVTMNKDIAHLINENALGMKTIKSMSLEERVTERAASFFRELKNKRVKIGFHESVILIVTQPISLIYVAIIFAFVYQKPDFNFSSFAVIIYLVQKMFAYVQNAQSKLHSINEFLPYLRSSVQYHEQAIRNEEANKGVLNFSFQKKLQFEDVTFSYETSKPILQNIKVTINKGGMVGLIGASGSGKTTMVDLLLRLLVPQSGKITIDDSNINSINLEEWRTNIGYVSQDIFLLNDTVKNNITFFNPSFSEQEVEEAARKANIYDFIMSLPKQFNTLVGERGLMLSGGQRQRIILSRILIRKPSIIVLDEATSALDNASEAEIQKVLLQLKGSVTFLIIAHRLTTIQECDKIIAIDNGRVLEEGSPNELLKNSSSYFYKTTFALNN